MIKEECGGMKCLKEFVKTGNFTERKITLRTQNAAKPLPRRGRRLETLEARQIKRDRYYWNVSQRLDDGARGPSQSPWAKWHVERARLAMQ